MIKTNKVIRYKYRPHKIKNNEYMDECKCKKETVFILPDDLGDKFKLPEKFNDEWLKTATLEDKIKFMDEFLSQLDDNSKKQNFM